MTAEDVEVLIADLIEVEKLLPPHALELLQKDTPLYINSRLEYGYIDEAYARAARHIPSTRERKLVARPWPLPIS